MKKERLAKAGAEKTTEAEKKAHEADDEALSKKAEMKLETNKTVVVDEHHKENDDGVISCSTGSPHSTPKSVSSTADAAQEKQEMPPVSGGPPAPVEQEEPLPVRARPAYDSAGESSDSPVEDWEALYSSDDLARKPRPTQANFAAAQDDHGPEEDDSEEMKMPEPWNAICIVGVRVYSKDEKLELRTVMEDGELIEGGMGPKGAADLDNAQSNAGGARVGHQDAFKSNPE